MTDTTKTAEALKRVLGDTYALYLKTHGYHWNVEGPNFKSLHELFELNYTQMWQSMDEIAERIRALGVYAPMGAELAQLAAIDSTDNSVPSANAMVQNLVSGHETFLEGAKKALDIAQEAGDPATEGLLADLITAHEKMAWMLRSSLER
ncbi:Dps family protein [Parvularcula lutaonensis]|uniref:Dps family protein n=1 Tax=Parvularcula lutaonensis TaxID=491923 RepID=A0ABV7M9K9_9PROT|nr:DNA starvation/stationary phase protection protein [Parvularcula lutaonensis]GGY43707.1 DNA starvation/stationary phase protection protein [Parvularcula lutaonensis]